MAYTVKHFWASERPNVEIAELVDGRYIALSDWNGDHWCECWDSIGTTGYVARETAFECFPVYAYELNADLDPESDDAIEIVALNIIECEED